MVTPQSPYDEGFFRQVAGDARRAAHRVLPLLLEAFAPASVVDVGCGTGSWLAECRRRGVTDVLGIDGDWVPAGALEIPKESFLRSDLTEPLTIDRRFDLVLSLEVAEHLPAEAAKRFVRDLSSLGDVVVFSAAIPGQGGVAHVNEQWPDYWVALFRERGFAAFDPLRFQFWSTPDVPWYYSQNMMVFVADLALEQRRAGLDWLAAQPAPIPSLVHPECYRAALTPSAPGLRAVLAALPSALSAAVRRRLYRRA